MDKYCKELGLRFKVARINIGIMQSTMAETTMLSQSQLSCIEHGRKYLKSNRYHDLCDACDIPFEDVLEAKKNSELYRKQNNPNLRDLKELVKRIANG